MGERIEDRELVLTADGSHTVRIKNTNITFHSSHGALRESRHIFIDCGIHHYSSINAGIKRIRIFEWGFGTGLNALLSMLYARKHQVHIEYSTVENHPLGAEIIHALNYPKILDLSADDRNLFYNMHKFKTFHKAGRAWSFSLERVSTMSDFSELPVSDIVFFDAFGPTDQPEIWNIDSLAVMHNLLDINGHLITFCSQGQFKRNLTSIGFAIECPAGPPGKREITRAIKIQGL